MEMRRVRVLERIAGNGLLHLRGRTHDDGDIQTEDPGDGAL
jgi:hypothetical protein